MNRRDFIAMVAASSAVSLIPAQAIASQSNTMAGGLYHTKEAPGRWNKKAAGHLPQIEVGKDAEGANIKVTTAHGMTGFEHYIVKHVVLDKDYKFLAEKMFDPSKDKAPISSFSLGKYTGTVHVLSVCNKHDTWLSSATV